MKLIEFEGTNVIYAKDQPEYMPLPALKIVGDPEGKMICCWKLSWKERIKALIFGEIWHQILTFNHPLQPQLLTMEKPFKIGV